MVEAFAKGENAIRAKQREMLEAEGKEIPADLQESNDFPLDAMGPDTVHLILEYSAGETFAGFAPPRANRYILNSDDRMADPTYADRAFDAGGVGYDADAAVLAGLHMYEALPTLEDQRKAVIQVRDPFYQVFEEAAKHIELASVGTKEFMKLLALEALPAADSVGMNEQELADLFEATGGAYDPLIGVPSRDLLVRPQPGSPEACAAALRHVISAQRNYRINRIHLHTLAFHMEVRRDGRVEWRDATNALFSGALRATTKACGGVRAEELDEDDLRLLAPMRVDAGDPAARFQFAMEGRKQVQKELLMAHRGSLGKVGLDALESLRSKLVSDGALNDSTPISDLPDGDLFLLARHALRRVPRGIDVSFVGVPEPEVLALAAEDAEFELQSGLAGKRGTPEWEEAVASKLQETDRQLARTHPEAFQPAAASKDKNGERPKPPTPGAGSAAMGSDDAPELQEEEDEGPKVDPRAGLGSQGIHRTGSDGMPIPNRRHWNSLNISPEVPGVQWEWPMRPQRLAYRMARGTVKLSPGQKNRLKRAVEEHEAAVAEEESMREQEEGEGIPQGEQPELQVDALGRDLSLPTVPLTELKEPVLTFAYVPVLVCKHPKSTVGLGDAISATGLLAALPPSPGRGKYKELRDYMNQKEEQWVSEGLKQESERIVYTTESAKAFE